MKASIKFFVYFFNFHGILNLRIHKNSLKISKLLIIINLVITPYLCFIPFFLPLSIYVDYFKNEIIYIKGISKFLQATMIAILLQFYFITFCIFYMQLCNQKNILDLYSNCLRAFRYSKVEIEEKFLTSFRRSCWKTFRISIFISIFWNFISIISTLKPKFPSLLVLLLFNWNMNTVTYFAAFVSIFLNYFLCLLKVLNFKVENLLRRNLESQSLLTEFMNLYDLVKEFNKIFGLLLSLVVLFLVSNSTIRVNAKINFIKEKKLKFVFSQLYLSATSFRGNMTLSWETKLGNLLSFSPYLLILVCLVIAPCRRIQLEVAKAKFKPQCVIQFLSVEQIRCASF